MDALESAMKTARDSWRKRASEAGILGTHGARITGAIIVIRTESGDMGISSHDASALLHQWAAVQLANYILGKMVNEDAVHVTPATTVQ